MTEAENNSLETQGDANAGNAGAENTPGTNEVNQAPAWHSEVLSWAKENGREIADVNELLTPTQVEVEKEIVKEVNPWEDVMDERTKGYLTYRKETGRDWEAYQALQRDIDAIDPIVIAREQAKKELGVPSLSDDMADKYIAEKFNFDLEELTDFDKIKLLGYGKDIREAMKAEQEKYRLPAEPSKTEQQPAYNPENYIELPNGAVMTKEQHAAHESKLNEHIGHLDSAVRSWKEQTFTIEVEDNNGEKREIPFTYDFSAEEIDGMSDFAKDLMTGKIVEKYRTESGFNYEAFAKDLFVNPVIGKMTKRLLQNAHATAVEEVMKQNGNHSFTPQLPQNGQQREGVRIVPFDELRKLK